MSNAICANKITFQYEPQEGKVAVPVFEDLSLDIAEGSFVAVLGHNGSGKSTLAKHFNAILLPQGGSVTVFGTDTADEDRLLDVRRAAATRAGGQGMRYTCRVMGHCVYLFEDEGRWFVEARDRPAVTF